MVKAFLVAAIIIACSMGMVYLTTGAKSALFVGFAEVIAATIVLAAEHGRQQGRRP